MHNMIGLFKNKNGSNTEAMVKGGKWQIIKRSKKPLGKKKRSGEAIKQVGEVIDVLAELSNEGFKAQFVPVDTDGLAMFNDMPAPEVKKKSTKILPKT